MPAAKEKERGVLSDGQVAMLGGFKLWLCTPAFPNYQTVPRRFGRFTLALPQLDTRERLGWLEVAHLMFPAMAYNFDLEQLWTKLSQDTVDSQLPSGLVGCSFTWSTAVEWLFAGKCALSSMITHLQFRLTTPSSSALIKFLGPRYSARIRCFPRGLSRLSRVGLSICPHSELAGIVVRHTCACQAELCHGAELRWLSPRPAKRNHRPAGLRLG